MMIIIANQILLYHKIHVLLLFIFIFLVMLYAYIQVFVMNILEKISRAAIVAHLFLKYSLFLTLMSLFSL